jgi:hypothetical protein
MLRVVLPSKTGCNPLIPAFSLEGEGLSLRERPGMRVV